MEGVTTIKHRHQQQQQNYSIKKYTLKSKTTWTRFSSSKSYTQCKVQASNSCDLSYFKFVRNSPALDLPPISLSLSLIVSIFQKSSQCVLVRLNHWGQVNRANYGDRGLCWRLRAKVTFNSLDRSAYGAKLLVHYVPLLVYWQSHFRYQLLSVTSTTSTTEKRIRRRCKARTLTM